MVNVRRRVVSYMTPNLDDKQNHESRSFLCLAFSEEDNVRDMIVCLLSSPNMFMFFLFILFQYVSPIRRNNRSWFYSNLIFILSHFCQILNFRYFYIFFLLNTNTNRFYARLDYICFVRLSVGKT